MIMAVGVMRISIRIGSSGSKVLCLSLVMNRVMGIVRLVGACAERVIAGISGVGLLFLELSNIARDDDAPV